MLPHRVFWNAPQSIACNSYSVDGRSEIHDNRIAVRCPYRRLVARCRLGAFADYPLRRAAEIIQTQKPAQDGEARNEEHADQSTPQHHFTVW